MRELRRTITLH